MSRRALVVLVVIGVAASLAILVQRVQLEAAHRTVDIVLDGGDWITLIRREGRELNAMLRELRARGATAVAIPEATLKQLAAEGLVGYASGGDLRARNLLTGEFSRKWGKVSPETLRPDALYISSGPEMLAFLGERLGAVAGEERVRSLGGVLEVRGTQLDLEELGLGARPEDAAPFLAAGFEIVLRPRNYRGLTPPVLSALADSYAQVAPSPTLIFALTEVQGHEGLVEHAAAQYRRLGARFGRIEVFSVRRKQKGEDALTRFMRPTVIKVFSLTPEELQTLPPIDVVEKFVRSAQERSVRLLYVRPLLFTPAGAAAMDVNLGVVERIAGGLRALGYSPGRAEPLQPLRPPAPLVWLAVLGAAALGLLVIDDLARVLGVTLPRLLAPALLAMAVVGTIVFGRTGLDGLWRQVLALGVATAGGAGAAVWAMPRRPGHPVAAGYATLGRAAIIAACTGVFVTALLSSWAFMMAFSVFLGVKVAHIVPVALVAVWVAFAQRPPGGWRAASREMLAWFHEPLRIGGALAALAVAAGIVLLLARTGNISIPLLEVEAQLRAWLERALVARPRTKEFLVGYPMLVMAGMAAGLGWRRAALVFIVAGTIGTVGLINSFSHIHTPVLYVAWRTANALVLGAILAVPGVVVLHWIARRLATS